MKVIESLQDVIIRQTLSYSGHIVRKDGLERTVMLGMEALGEEE